MQTEEQKIIKELRKQFQINRETMLMLMAQEIQVKYLELGKKKHILVCLQDLEDEIKELKQRVEMNERVKLLKEWGL